jgi:TP901-1 family phage major tail protein
MAVQRGKDMLLKIEGAPGVFTTVAGLRARTISLNARSVDATDGDSAGRWRELLDGAGVKSAAVSGQGIFRDAASDALIREAFFSQSARTWRLIVPEEVFTAQGLAEQPWAPCHLRVVTLADGGRKLTWLARSRIDGDRWDGDAPPADPMRFRLRVLDGDLVVRTFEAEAMEAVYDAASLVVDFPGGLGGDAAVATAQWGERYGGWGREVRTPLT